MSRISVQTENFDIGAEFAALTAGRTDIGGIGCFVGTVRGPVTAMTLEHYPAMTERAIACIVEEAERRWSLLACTVIHRYGRLCAGENIVLVLTAAPHRQPALGATAFLIDWLKTKAPFWKKEESASGGESWVEARLEDDAAAARW
jgi:molybdopterin synthase catalytic subunit